MDGVLGVTLAVKEKNKFVNRRKNMKKNVFFYFPWMACLAWLRLSAGWLCWTSLQLGFHQWGSYLHTINWEFRMLGFFRWNKIPSTLWIIICACKKRISRTLGQSSASFREISIFSLVYIIYVVTLCLSRPGQSASAWQRRWELSKGPESQWRTVCAKLESNSEPERARVSQRVAVGASERQSGSYKEP